MKAVLLTPEELLGLMKQAAALAVETFCKLNPEEHKTTIDDKLLSRSEVAIRTGKTPTTVSNWIRTGRLKSQKIERNVFVKESDLNEALNAGGNR